MTVTPAEASLVVGVLSMSGTIIVAFIAHKGKNYAKSADDAVNHAKENGTPRIYDLVIENHQRGDRVEKQVMEIVEWKRSYGESPWDDGDGVQEWLKDHQDVQKQILARLDAHEGICAEARKSICKLHDPSKGKD